MKTTPRWAGAGRACIELARPSGRLFSCLTLLALSLGLGAIPLRPGVVLGSSMEPTFRSGQPFLYRPRAAGEGLRRGDVVVLRLGGEPAIKRIFALAGETYWTACRVEDGTLPPAVIPPGGPIAAFRRRFPAFRYRRCRVPQGCVYVLGDGPNSLDSRSLGPVEEADVLGSVVCPLAGGEERLKNVGAAWNALPPLPDRPIRSGFAGARPAGTFPRLAAANR
jgi:signal peptidase I